MRQPAELFSHADDDARVARDLLLPYLNHAATMYQSGYATAADIDAAMRFGCGYPTGPLTFIDEIGLGTVVDALGDLYERTGDPLHNAAQVLVNMASSGESFGEVIAAGADEADPELHHDFRTVGVVGTGTMATGIAEVFAKAGYDVVYVGRTDEKTDAVHSRIFRNLDKAMSRGKLDEDGKSSVIEKLTGSTEREALADADIVVEAIAEDLPVKQDLFASLDKICKSGAVLATTTSSLSIQACADATSRPQDVIGMHFFNPATAMKLVEVVTTAATSSNVAESVHALCWQVGKHPVSCSDRAGFIANALLFPYLNDAVSWHEDHDMGLGDIDRVIKETGLPMGPFELLDVVGADVSLAIQRSLVGAFGHAGWEPAPMLVDMVERGRMGRKTGAGFHDYE